MSRGAQVPRGVPKGSPSSGAQQSDPPYDLLKHNGFDLASWYLAGKPALKPLQRG
jgi:hypothetical protein